MEYSENAVIANISGHEALSTDKDGFKCIPSSQNFSLDFTIRNPQKYTLNFSYVFNDLNGYFDATDPISIVQSEDKLTGKITFPKSELIRLDRLCENNKNISGYITLTESRTLRNFQSFPLSFHVNSTPPAVQKTAFMTSKEDLNDEDCKYVIGLYVPVFANPSSNTNSVHYNDTRMFIVEHDQISTTYYIKDGNSSDLYRNFSNTDGVLTYANPATDVFTTSPGTLFGIGEAGSKVSFDDANPPESGADGVSFTKLYYLTGIKPSDYECKYSFKIQDDSGLSSEFSISNKAKKLTVPVMELNATEGIETIFTADEITGYYNYSITHNGLATDDSPVQNFYINYSLKDSSGTVITQGKSLNSANINLEPGIYKLSAWASKDNFVTSDTKYLMDNASTTITVKRPAIYYVSASGSDEGLGSRNSPYATIQKTLTAIEANTDITIPASASDPNAVTAEIRLLSDITLAQKITYPTQKKVLITGADGYGRTINGNNGLIFVSASPASGFKYITFKNITLTGGKGTSASIIGMNKTNVVFDNCTITGNTAASGGTATIIGISDSNATFKNCTVKNNTMAKLSTGYNGALYYYINTQTSCKLYFEGKNYFYDNFQKYDGKSIPSNVCLNHSSGNALINFLGSIEGSKIGVRKPVSDYKPGIGSPKDFTSGYSTYNSLINPGDIFISDDGYNIGWNAAKNDAAFYVSAVTPEIVSHDNIELTSATTYLVNIQSATVAGRTVTFNAYDKGTGEDLTSKTTAWTYKVKYNNRDLPSSYYSTSGNKITFDSSVLVGVYAIELSAVVNGTQISTTHDVSVKESESISNYSVYPSEGSFVTISNTSEFLKFNTLLNAYNDADAPAITVIQTGEVSVTNFTCLGTNTTETKHKFKGTYNGNGHTITITDSPDFYGLFSQVLSNTTIENVTTAGTVNITTQRANSFVAGIVKQIPSSSGYVTVKGCINKLNITDTSVSDASCSSINYLSGIVAVSENSSLTLSNCRNEGNLTGMDITTGMIGYMRTTNTTIIDRCINTGNIKSAHTTCSSYNNNNCITGGIAGRYGGLTATIKNCINRGNITGGKEVGGISPGFANTINCINYGNITGREIAGGITAHTWTATDCVKNCVNTGTVTITVTGTNNPGQFVSIYNSSDYPVLDNNFYLKPSTVTRAVGQDDTSTGNSDKHCGFTKSGSRSTTETPLTVDGTTSSDVVELLNAWINSQPTPASYVRWTYGADGLPKMVMEN